MWCKTLHQYFKQHYLLITYLGQKEKVAYHGYGPAGVSLDKRSGKGRPRARTLRPASQSLQEWDLEVGLEFRFLFQLHNILDEYIGKDQTLGKPELPLCQVQSCYSNGTSFPTTPTLPCPCPTPRPTVVGVSSMLLWKPGLGPS